MNTKSAHDELKEWAYGNTSERITDVARRAIAEHDELQKLCEEYRLKIPTTAQVMVYQSLLNKYKALQKERDELQVANDTLHNLMVTAEARGVEKASEELLQPVMGYWHERNYQRMRMKLDFSQGRAIGTHCETNNTGQYRLCLASDSSIKLSGWHNDYNSARNEAILLNRINDQQERIADLQSKLAQAEKCCAEMRHLLERYGAIGPTQDEILHILERKLK